jgi:hypothetical protein
VVSWADRQTEFAKDGANMRFDSPPDSEATEIATAHEPDRLASLRNLAAVCGGLAGVGGLTHGVGEVLQGSGPPGGLVFDSWAEGRIASNLGGEPAMTLVPDLLLTGTLTIIVSLAVALWAVAFVGRRHGGTGLVLLSLLMLLVGGGFGPPVLGMLAGLAAGGAHAPRRRWARRLGGRPARVLASLWLGLFWFCLLNAIFLVVGSLVLAGALGLAAPDLFVYSLFLVVASMPIATLAGIAYDVRYARGSQHDANIA